MSIMQWSKNSVRGQMIKFSFCFQNCLILYDTLHAIICAVVVRLYICSSSKAVQSVSYSSLLDSHPNAKHIHNYSYMMVLTV